MKNILLTFDVEEFDLPREFNLNIPDKDMLEISKEGLINILALLEKHQISSTFFTTAFFAKNNPSIIGDLPKKGHEIASHGFSHSDSYIKDLSKIQIAKTEKEKIIGEPIRGFRAPRFQIEDISQLHNLGFVYDSSIYPTIAPGKYFNIRQNRKIHKQGKIIEIPLSTLPLFPFIRAPFNWYMFRHFPSLYGKIFTKINFSFSNYLMLLFHPWEFIDLKDYKIPKSFKKNSGEFLLKKLDKYLKFCRDNKYEFSTISRYLENTQIIKNY